MQKLIKYLISNNDNPSLFLKFQVVIIINASNAMNIQIYELDCWKNTV